MAQHGYLREYDQDFDRDEDRERGWSDRERSERGRGAFFDDDRERFRDRDEDDRGFFSRMGDEARSWFRDDERDYRPSGRDRGMSGYSREHGYGGYQGDYSRSGRQQGGFGGYGDYDSGRRSFSPHRDDHYLSWRDKQIEALDRDYQDYCREREQSFHQDFDSWRSNRQQGQGQGQQSGSSAGPMDLTQSATGETSGGTSPLGAATLGTNNAENTAGEVGTTGRRRR